MKHLALIFSIVLLSACTGTHRPPVEKPAAETETKTGLSISGSARFGVVKKG